MTLFNPNYHYLTKMAANTCARTLTGLVRGNLFSISRTFSTTGVDYGRKFPLVVVGGGTGGASTASAFCRKLGKGKVAVIEPAMYHYYQPMWTLVGAGAKTIDQSTRSMEQVLPSSCEWIRDRAVEFDPEKNTVTIGSGEQIEYDYLVVALGIQLDYGKIPGLIEALESDPMVCSNYWRKTVEKTYPAIQSFQGGDAIFTFPNTPIKCAGAPQKIMYLAEEYWRKHGVRDKTNIKYNTALGVIFGVKKYAAALTKVCQARNILVNVKTNLVEISHKNREAVFENLDTGDKQTQKYDFIHVAPPMSSPDCLKTSRLAGPNGFVSVNKNTTQHTKYPNVFGVGDCTDIPTSKTAAAVAAEMRYLKKNLKAVMKGQPVSPGGYDGYTSCPLITGYSKCILAEFDFDGQPLETFPIDQGKPRTSMFIMKAHLMPELYWKMLLTGHWEGPQFYRKLMHLGMGK